MSERVEGELARIRNHGMTQGISQGEKNIIAKLLANNSLDEVSKLIGMETNEILEILEK